MKETLNIFTALLEQGHCFRYTPERYQKLIQGGHLCPSPIRYVDTPHGQMIEEVIQPTLDTVRLLPADFNQARQLANIWPLWLKSQIELTALARQGKLDPELTELIKLTCTSQEWELGLTSPGYRYIHPFVRLDAILTPQGFKVVDINTTRPAGVGDIIAYQQVMKSKLPADTLCLPIDKCFIKTVKHCLDDWSAVHHLPGESLGVRIVIPPDEGDWRNFENLALSLIAEGYDADLLAPTELAHTATSAIIRGRIKEGSEAFELLKPCYPNGRCVMSPLYRRFLGNKIWMHLLRSPLCAQWFREQLGQVAYNLLDKTFAETGLIHHGKAIMSQGTMTIYELPQSEWVIKDPAASSARRMGLGIRMGKAKWNEFCQEAESNSYLTPLVAHRFYANSQEVTVADKVGDPTRVKLYTKYGLFIFGNELGGAEFNARPSPVVHGARDTYMNAVFGPQIND